VLIRPSRNPNDAGIGFGFVSSTFRLVALVNIETPHAPSQAELAVDGVGAKRLTGTQGPSLDINAINLDLIKSRSSGLVEDGPPVVEPVGRSRKSVGTESPAC
jgi:hypothetical protein